MERRGATWCDVFVLPDGSVGWAYSQGHSVVCESAETGARQWTLGVGHEVLYTRADADGGGRVLAAGPCAADGVVRAAVHGARIVSLGLCPFPFGVLVRGLVTGGWIVFIQRTAAWYDEVLVSTGGEVQRFHERAMPTPPPPAQGERAMPPTSQGFLYVGPDGLPVTQDAGRHVHGLALPSPAGGVWAGQSTRAFRLELYDEETGQLSLAREGVGQPPHIVRRGDDFFVCAYVDGAAWVERFRRPLPAIGGPPPVIPPKEPDVSVRDVPNLIRVIEQVKNDFPAAWRNCHRPDKSRAEAEEFARRAAWACSLADARFGLNGKRGDPNTISQDCVCFKHDDGRESVIDFGAGAGGDNPAVQWSIVGHYLPPGPPLQLWIRAERVDGGSQQPPTTPPTTPPVQSRPFPVPRWPEDVFLHALTRYINEGLYERDKPVENGAGDRTSSRGGLMWFVPIATEELIADIVAHGNTIPTPARWWALADRVAAKAITFYRQTAPPE